MGLNSEGTADTLRALGDIHKGRPQWRGRGGQPKADVCGHRGEGDLRQFADVRIFEIFSYDKYKKS